MESTKYCKMMNITKRIKLIDVENNLVGISWGGRYRDIGMGEWEVQMIGYKIGSRIDYTT